MKKTILFTCLIALLAAWYVSFALQGTEFASYISASLALSQNLEVVGLVAVLENRL